MADTIHHALYDSPLGTIEIEAVGDAIVGLGFRARPRQKKTPDGNPPVCLKQCLRQLDEYFHGTRRDFDVRVAVAGTGFQKCVWRELVRIPFGATRTYGDIAARIGKPKAARAVGQANNKNPIAIIVPCHRVVGLSDLVGYAGGLRRKRWLLAHELRQGHPRAGPLPFQN